MKDTIVVRGARQHNLKGFDLEIPRRALHRHHGPVGLRANRRSRSTRSTPRVSDGTSSRCRRTRGSFSSAWRSPTSTRSTACRPRSRSSRRIRRRRRARPSGPPPRSTTTCACSGRASAARSARCAAARSSPTRCSRSPTRCSRLPAGTRFSVAFPLRLSDKVTHDVVVENLRAQGFVRVSARRRDQAPRRSRRPRRSTSRSRKRAARRRRSAGRRRRARAAASPTRSARRFAKATATA